MDGALINGQSSKAITITAKNYVPGKHYLSVDVTKNEESYSKTLIFRITQ
jgi:hypothetical protein